MRTAAPIPADASTRLRHARLAVAVLAALLAIALVAVVLLARGSPAPGGGSGVAATEVRAMPSFSAIELAGGNVVTVRVGGRRSVVVHADDNLLDRVTTRVRDGRLVVGTTGTVRAVAPMRVAVTVPRLESAVLSGNGVVTVAGVRAGALALSVPGNGVVRVTGTVGRLRATLDGSGDMQLGELVARDVTAHVGGAGRLILHVTRSLDARIDGSGLIAYAGDPAHVTREITGTGVIEAR